MAFLCDKWTACVSFYKCVVIYRYVVVICMRYYYVRPKETVHSNVHPFNVLTLLT